MKSTFYLLPLLALVSLRAADDKSIAAVRAADAERVAATLAGDGPRLNAIFSDELRFAHSIGLVDTKVSYMKSLTSHSTVYESYDYKEQNFLPAGPGIVLMTGRALVHVRIAQVRNDLDMNFLAVWREEGGMWRMLAWQSCKNPPPAPTAK